MDYSHSPYIACRWGGVKMWDLEILLDFNFIAVEHPCFSNTCLVPQGIDGEILKKIYKYELCVKNSSMFVVY